MAEVAVFEYVRAKCLGTSVGGISQVMFDTVGHFGDVLKGIV